MKIFDLDIAKIMVALISVAWCLMVYEKFKLQAERIPSQSSFLMYLLGFVIMIVFWVGSYYLTKIIMRDNNEEK